MNNFNELSNFDLIDNVFCAIDDKVNAHGLNSLIPEEKNVYSIWSALGVLENGSFQYFYETQLNTLSTAQSFEDLGLPTSAECFRLAQSLLPADYFLLNWTQQLEILKQRETSLDTLAKKILGETNQTEARLSNYIRINPKLIALKQNK